MGQLTGILLLTASGKTASGFNFNGLRLNSLDTKNHGDGENDVGEGLHFEFWVWRRSIEFVEIRVSVNIMCLFGC